MLITPAGFEVFFTEFGRPALRFPPGGVVIIIDWLPISNEIGVPRAGMHAWFEPIHNARNHSAPHPRDEALNRSGLRTSTTTIGPRF
jgi:hypothetical protein